MRILGIDPGTAITGFGIIEKMGNSFKAIEYGCIRTPANMELSERLVIIHREVAELIRQFAPQEVAIEELFFNNNARTALSVGHARGVIMLAAAEARLPIGEYTPLQVKQAVVGYGRAEKKQVQIMIKTLLNLSAIPKPDDVADALAIAICHGHSSGGVWSNLAKYTK